MELKTCEHTNVPDDSIPEECIAEMKVKDQRAVHSLMVAEEPRGIGQIINCKEYSSFRKLLNVTAYLLKFVRLLKARFSGEASSISEAEDRARAEILRLVDSQALLTRDKSFSDWKGQFGLFLDDKGLWRCGGRLSNADIPYSTKHPIMLHKDHYTGHKERPHESTTQWREGNLDGDTYKILVCQGEKFSQKYNTQVCCLPEVRRNSL